MQHFDVTIHVNIGDAEARLSELVAAVIGGADVVLDSEGEPQVRLVTVAQEASIAGQRAVKRRAAFDMFRHLAPDREIDVLALKADDRWEEHYGRKFDDID